MISWMQKHRKYLVITIWISTIAFVGAGFVGWGMYDFNLDRASSVAKVGDEKITVKEFQNAYSNLYRYYNENVFKGTLTKEKAKELKLEDLTLNQLIRDALLTNYAHELGMEVLNKELEEKLTQMKIFQTNGVFDKNKYYSILKQLRREPKEFEESLKKEILLDKLKDLLSLKAAKVEEEAFASALFMADRLEITTIYAKDINVSIDENETKSFWEKNKNKYMITTTYDVEAIKVDIKDINVTDKEAEEFYKNEKFRYKDENGKILSFQKAKDRVIKDLKFKKAKKIALKKYLLLKKGKIKAEEKMRLAEGKDNFPFEKLKKAKKGDVLKPIKQKNGFLVIKLDIINLPKPMKYEDAKNFVKQDLLEYKKLTLLEEKAKKMVDNFKGKDIGFVTRDDYKKLESENFGENEALEFLNAVFSSTKKASYYLFKDRAVLYKVVDQKLFDKKKLKENKDIIIKNIERLKESVAENALINRLAKKYEIVRYK
ncbi:MAG: peptidylprolyl isomerase [Epsilonproteobacteria bacterium]|nr:peptidylprolyl isomerase [Campylobacterota bacterium]